MNAKTTLTEESQEDPNILGIKQKEKTIAELMEDTGNLEEWSNEAKSCLCGGDS